MSKSATQRSPKPILLMTFNKGVNDETKLVVSHYDVDWSCYLGRQPHTLAYEIEKCDATAEGDVKIAAQYIEDNLEEIVATFAHTQLTQDHRDEFIRKWPRAKIVCRDEGSMGVARECAVSTGLGGMAHGGLGNKINICYYNKLEINETLCEYGETSCT